MSYRKVARQRRDAWKKGGQDALDWLMERYQEWLPAYPHQADGTSQTAQMAIGFWLRRGLDGTHTELWTGLRKVLLSYDREWFASLKTRYPAARVEWPH
jgi:hypothetical protein